VGLLAFVTWNRNSRFEAGFTSCAEACRSFSRDQFTETPVSWNAISQLSSVICECVRGFVGLRFGNVFAEAEDSNRASWRNGRRRRTPSDSTLTLLSLLTLLTEVGKIPEPLSRSPRSNKVPRSLASFLPPDCTNSQRNSSPGERPQTPALRTWEHPGLRSPPPAGTSAELPSRPTRPPQGKSYAMVTLKISKYHC
jgi:hypothetical protein